MKLDEIADVGVLDPEVKDEKKTEQPKLWTVVLNNDDYTPFDLVVHILQQVFRINQDNAVQLMLSAHKSGKVLLGKFTKDIAETKAKQAMDIAKSHEQPLLFSIEEE